MIAVLTQRTLKFGALVLTKNRKKLFGNKIPAPTIFYFAYGANLDPKRFEKYSMNAVPIDVARLDGYRLNFGLPCEYTGKGYASIELDKNSTVWGYLYKLDGLAITLLDIMEYVFLRHYKKIEVTVQTRTGVEGKAYVYVSGFPTTGLIPSTEYKKKILQAAEKHGFPESYLAYIRTIPSQDSFELDPGYSLLNPNRRRPFEKLLRSPYLMHDKLREKICALLQF